MQLGVVIVAAGSSSRMGSDKLMQQLGESFVLQHSVATFCALPQVCQVSVVCSPERFSKLSHHSKLKQVDGGKERHLSVQTGILSLPKVDYIAVHDGARPLIDTEQIMRVFEAAIIDRAATSAKRVSDTLKRGDDYNFTTSSVSREDLWSMETPQIFSQELLLQAYQKVIEDDLLVTDEVSAIEHLGVPTKLIANPRPNLKITYPEDLHLAKLLINNSSSTYV